MMQISKLSPQEIFQDFIKTLFAKKKYIAINKHF